MFSEVIYTWPEMVYDRHSLACRQWRLRALRHQLVTTALASARCSLTCCHNNHGLCTSTGLSPMIITTSGFVGTRTTLLHPLHTNGIKVRQSSDLFRIVFISFFLACTITVCIVPLLDHAWCLIFGSHPSWQLSLERFYPLPLGIGQNLAKRIGQQAC